MMARRKVYMYIGGTGQEVRRRAADRPSSSTFAFRNINHVKLIFSQNNPTNIYRFALDTQARAKTGLTFCIAFSS